MENKNKLKYAIVASYQKHTKLLNLIIKVFAISVLIENLEIKRLIGKKKIY